MQGSSPRMRGKPLLGVLLAHSLGLIPAHAGKTSRVQSLKPSGRAHPRACGENLTGPELEALGQGSSPRMRGKHRDQGGSQGRDGLIPAHAGKTEVAGRLNGAIRAHPRACGENAQDVPNRLATAGSSPRMRGKHITPEPVKRGTGLIPAHAGKTARRRSGSRAWAAHPRACGENLRMRGLPFVDWGSSPRMRGKPHKRGLCHLGCRLIPAHAGKTRWSRSDLSTPWAHPRACGENADLLTQYLPNAGSSPRMRGKRPLWRSGTLSTGLIPAHAGKTPSFPGKPLQPRAHPRACGENQRSETTLRVKPGSSPRMRGKRLSVLAHTSTYRLIPAHAGKTCVGCCLGNRFWAHPRACGENYVDEATLLPEPGSSPRMRGKPPGRAQPCLGPRLIPAHAGKTRLPALPMNDQRAHPRACGENPFTALARSPGCGSSPRMRGKQRDFWTRNTLTGLIPAHAGKTPVCLPRPRPSHRQRLIPAHAGKTAKTNHPSSAKEGSSPRMRGKPPWACMPACSRRLIPAHAGKT